MPPDYNVSSDPNKQKSDSYAAYKVAVRTFVQEVAIGFAKYVPGFEEVLAAAVRAAEAYDDYLKLQSIRRSVKALAATVHRLEGLEGVDMKKLTGGEWLETEEGVHFVRHVVAIMQDYQHTDKAMYFTNCLFSKPNEFTDVEREKLLSEMKKLSLGALQFLAWVSRGPKFPSADRHGTLRTNLDLVCRSAAESLRVGEQLHPASFWHACWLELYNVGALEQGIDNADNASWRGPDMEMTFKGPLSITDFGKRFLEFMSPPALWPLPGTEDTPHA